MRALAKLKSLLCRAKQVDDESFEPSRPSMPDVALINPPKIHTLDIEVKTRGRYRTPSRQARGLVVHYTAGRSLRGGLDAENSLRFMASQGFGCLVMDIDGQIYRAINQDLSDVAFHAGPSEWQGVKGLSYHLMGMEICNAGLLDTDLKAWFGEQMPLELVRVIDRDVDNIRAGAYHRFTVEQEKSLIDFCLWQKAVNPEFDFQWVLGHDEICMPRGRKQDPGGSLSMSMPEFRQMLVDSTVYTDLKLT